MKYRYHVSTMVLGLILCTGIFMGCSKKDGNIKDNKASFSSDDTEDTSQTEETEQGDVIGRITYIGDASATGETEVSSAYFCVAAYTAPTELTDYVSVDVSTLQDMDVVSYVEMQWDAEYYTVYNGELQPVTFNDFGTGDWIAVTKDTEDVQQVILIKNVDEEMIDEEIVEDVDEVWQTDTPEE